MNKSILFIIMIMASAMTAMERSEQAERNIQEQEQLQREATLKALEDERKALDKELSDQLSPESLRKLNKKIRRAIREGKQIKFIFVPYEEK